MALGLAASLVAAGSACAADTTPVKDATAKEPAKAAPAKAAPAAPAKAASAAAAKVTSAKGTANEVAVMETSKGTMVIEFWEKDAPQTVANFKKLARQGFFDGTGFHRIIKNFMIQGGDPLSKNPADPNLGTGDPGYKIPDEFNSHKHVPGVLSMAHGGAPNSGGSQFFVMQGKPAPFLDGKYTAFGHVIQGMDVVDKIANTPCGPNPMMPGETSKPLEWTKVVSVKILSKAQAIPAVAGGAAAAKTAAAKAAAEKSASAVKASAEKAAAPAGSAVDMKKAMEGAKTAEPAAPAAPATPATKDSTAGK
jgi:peptidyl-prolyl cis-trans isomerase B (cyclophilin B)